MNDIRLRTTIAVAFLLLPFSGCSLTDGQASGSLVELASPAQPHSSQPNLAAGLNGTTYLSWIEVAEDGTLRLKLGGVTGEKWSGVQVIEEDQNLLVNWADFPSVIVMDGVLAAHWLTAVPGRSGYDVKIAVSADNGLTWSSPVTPHRDATATEHGFVTLSPNMKGGVDVLWLDSRKLEKGVDDVSLMHSTVDSKGALGGEDEVDPRVCECCAPSSTVIGPATLVAYRDRSDAEIRDIAVIRFDGQQWSSPKIVAEDNWQIYACPINGPAIDSQGEAVAVAWFTAADNTSRVKVAFSKDGGHTFGEAITVDDGNPRGRVDVAVVEDGAVVTWVEHSPEGGQVRVKRIDSDGTVRPSLVAGPTSVGNSSGFPRIQRTEDGAIVAWTDTDEHRVRTARWTP